MPGEPSGTGHAEVDAVLRSLDGLETRPLDEHVLAFETAHESLRAALSAAADGPSGRPGSTFAG